MKLLIRICLLLVPVFVQAQSVDEGRKQIYYQNYDNAIHLLQQVLKVEPANVDAWYWLSQAYYGNEHAQLFEDSLRFAPATIANEPLLYVIRGQLLLKKNKKDSATLYFDRALKETKKKNAFILSAIAKAHIDEKAGDGLYAIELLNKAIKREKKNPAQYTMLGDAYRKTGNGSEAYKAYQRALEIDPGYAAAAYKLGRIFVAQNNKLYLTHFEKAVAADPKYAPALYDLYYQYYFTDPARALDYFKRYQAASEYDVNNGFLYADLLYLNKNYNEAIDKTKKLMDMNMADTMPRLYKLLAYSYAGLTDTTSAIQQMAKYFNLETDTSHTSKDYLFMADLYAATDSLADSAAVYYLRLIDHLEDTSKRYQYYKKLADLNKKLDRYDSYADWLGKYYTGNSNASNLDLFNWGVAHFRAEEYPEADTVFALYIEKYPEQSYGYYWRARSNALLDSTMESGAAIPHYDRLIEVIKDDTTSATSKKWLIEAYGYLAAYETNTEKNYTDAISYLEKVLELDPQNKNARQYIDLLEKNIEESKAAGTVTEN